MRQNLIRQPNRRTPFRRFFLTFRPAIKDSTLKIDVSSTGFFLKRGLSYSLRATAGIERDQDEARDVPARMESEAAFLRVALVSICCPEQPRCFRSCQPSFPRRALIGHYDTDNAIMQTFVPMVINGRA
jgi:hypothetical protein